MLKEQHPTKNLQDFIKAIIDTKSKEEEDRIIVKNLELLKSEINNISASDAKQIEYAVKAIYSDMLGQDVSFAHIFVIKLIQSKNIEVKKIGYLASTLVLEHDSEFKILLAASITSDLAKKDELIVISALNAVCKLMLKDSAPAYLDQMIKLLSHKNPKIVQKALMGLQRIEQLCPNSIPRYAEEIRKGLQSKFPQVVQSAINIIYVELDKNKNMFLSLLPQLVQIQKQIIQKNMGYYYYQKIPEPFIQIQILKIITKLCQDNKKSSELVYEVLKQSLNRADNLSTDISQSVAYQCILTITKIFPKKELLEEVSESIVKFLSPNSKSNQIYLGINALRHLTEIDSSFIQKHQVFVVSCLESEDDTIRRITLELLYRNTNSANLEIITSKFIESLKTTTDVLFKKDLTKKIFSLCIRYTKSKEWLIEKIDLLLEYSHNDFTSEMLNELIHIYKENIEEDENFTEKLVHNYMEFFQKETLSAIMIKLVAWIIGNAGIPKYKNQPEFMQSLKEALKILMYMKNSDDSCKFWVLDSFEKLIRNDQSYKNDVFEFLQKFESDFSEEIRLKIFQMKLLLDEDIDDDFDVQDADLEFGFLTSFIQQKKGKFFDPEEAKNFEIFSTDQKDLNSLRFTHDVQNGQEQEHRLGQEADQLILDSNNKKKWTESGLVKEEKKNKKNEQEKVTQNEFKIFDEKDIKKPDLKPKKDSIQIEEEQKKKKNQNMANQLFSQGDDPMDIFGQENPTKKKKKTKKKKQQQNTESNDLDFFNTDSQQSLTPYEITMDQYQQYWEQIDNQVEKSVKIKTLRTLKDVPNFIQNLGFFIVEQNDQDFISAAKSGQDVVLMYVQFEKKKCIEVILNSKHQQTMQNLLTKMGTKQFQL